MLRLGAIARIVLTCALAEACGPTKAPRCVTDADCAPHSICVGTPLGVCVFDVRTDAGINTGIDGGAQDGGVDAGIASDAGTQRDAGAHPGAGVRRDGDICQTALPIEAGTHRGESTLGFENDYFGAQEGVGRCTGSDRGLDRVYSILVPAGRRLIAVVTPEPAPDAGVAYDPSVYLVSSPASNCDRRPRTCLGSDDFGTDSATNTAFHTNTGAVDERVFVVVDSYDSGDLGGRFTLDVSLDSPPAGHACEDAQRIAPGTREGETTLGFSNRYAYGSSANRCTASTAGRDRVYAIDVADGERLSVTARPRASYNPSLALIAGPAERCDASPRVCLASSDAAGPAEPEVVRFGNTTGARLPVLVLVDSAAPGHGTFDLDVTVEPLPVGETCATAQPIGAGLFRAQTTVGMTNDYSGAANGVANCTSSDRGLDRVYRVEVPAGQRLTAMVAPDEATGYDPSITLVAGPAQNCAASPRVCLAADDHGTADVQNVVQHTNAGATPAVVFIVIDNWSASDTGGRFTLTVSLEPVTP